MSTWKDRHFFNLNLNPKDAMQDDNPSTLPDPKTNPARYKDPEELGPKKAPLREDELPPGPRGPVTEPVTSPSVEPPPAPPAP